jgi:hypothetical protein
VGFDSPGRMLRFGQEKRWVQECGQEVGLERTASLAELESGEIGIVSNGIVCRTRVDKSSRTAEEIALENVFVINSIPTAQHRLARSEDIPGKPDARAERERRRADI